MIVPKGSIRIAPTSSKHFAYPAPIRCTFAVSWRCDPPKGLPMLCFIMMGADVFTYGPMAKTAYP